MKEDLAKQNAASKKRATLRLAIAAEEQQKRAERVLEYRTEDGVEFHVKQEKVCRDQEPGSNGEEFT